MHYSLLVHIINCEQRSGCDSMVLNGQLSNENPWLTKWSSDMMSWARAQGCTAPTVTTGNVDDDDI
jgi:hypothetical protein